ncbi:N-acetyltransferase GCN5 [Basidiobolus meristosporus CBS 931.73]|uniref:N-acetyltransferase GCN5 n=1 Tax=Basidiobolus meristosporus CBS 931.73 TaxID=1314790 RepID=A0A1Y1Y1C9_9FUNG|nr:N-acetyltransferase GCN5 [Basidiobolus meristosporus CBS 931.73]|eukprot:ORX91778.1 N-acetyltransferase GCN5 [Basidiobolus meristosporus CBS 931.73]
MTGTIVVRKVETDEQREQAYSIRKTVFVKEQNCKEENECDEYDPICLHWLAYYVESDGAELPVGTVRLVEYKPRVGKLGRLAVLREYRGMKVGKALSEAVENSGREQNWEKIILHAQQDKIGFYEAVGYEVFDSNIFYEEGIPHVKMVKTY